MKATIYKSTGSWYVTKTQDGKTYNARMKGVFKLDGITSTNPIAVGDKINIEMENELEHSVTITEILPRKNYINRQSPHSKYQHHIVAANLDQSILFATLKAPKTSQGFIDRFLVTCEAYHVPAIIIFNKADLYREKEMEKFELLQSIYESVGYKVILMSIPNKTGIEEARDVLAGKVTLMSGHSGVGKSSFINTIFPELGLKTQEVSDWSGKGMHTTTFAEMFDIPVGGQIIDTPGLREFGIVDISKQELSHYYPEMRVLIGDCQFNNCLHTDEPGCAIKKALEEGRISEERYVSYYNILESIDDKGY
jgi:ribosome biogenesis GTPase